MKMMRLFLMFMSCQVLASTQSYPPIYPFVAPPTSEINQAVLKFTEDPDYIKSIFQMMTPELVNGKSANQPWTSFYWQISNGLIADDYRRSFLNARLVTGGVFWKKRIKRFNRRFKNKLSKVYSLNQNQLDRLAPSEKYDLALGDMNFDLTHRLWDFSSKWGQAEEYSYITKAIIPKNYVLEKKSQMIAMWEGICHGWASSATIIPRPSRVVEFKLPNGKSLNFYPEDVKALIALTWANSEIQDGLFKTNEGKVLGGSIFGGLMGQRCWKDEPARDEWGRYYDPKKYVSQGKYESTDPNDPNAKYEARCVGVHPAVWHLGILNVMGKQGKSFIADIDANSTVNNHPVGAYKFEYFNPETGLASTNLNQNAVDVESYSDDPYKAFRNPETKFIVGVKTEMFYSNWAFPQKDETNNNSDDVIKSRNFMYDLELDKDGNVIGGQWRVNPTAAIDGKNPKIDWPDFMWKITNDWKKEFKGESNLTDWNDKTALPPQDWKKAAKMSINKYHNYTYLVTGNGGQRCKVVHKDNENDVKEIPCDIRYDRPQPLVNFVNELVDLAKD